MSHVVVVIGGGALSPRAVAATQDGWFDEARIIAADSGMDHAIAAGLRPSTLVGDLDSISAAGHMWAYAHEVDIQQHDPEKDLTDTELALALACEQADGGHVLVVGGVDADDPRFDHLLGTLLSLGHPSLAELKGLRAVLGDTDVAVVHGGRTTSLELDAGQIFSLLALHGPATGVTVTGAKWSLDQAELTGHEARGLSNIATGTVTIGVATGVVTAVIP